MAYSPNILLFEMCWSYILVNYYTLYVDSWIVEWQTNKFLLESVENEPWGALNI